MAAPSRERIIGNLDECWSSLDDLLDGLGEDDWAVQSLCPDWTVHGVATHLAAVEHVLAGWRPESLETPLPFDKITPFLADAKGWSGDELLARYRELIAARRDELASMTDADFETPSMTPVGPGTYGRFMAVRVFDFYVHEQDIRVPLARPGHGDGSAAEMTIDEIEGSLGYIVGKGIGLPDGKSIAFHLTGPVSRSLYAAVDGRAKVVGPIDDPDVEVTTDSLTFTLLACGRIDPQEPIDDGRVTWSGDAGLGEKAARSLRFTR
jgi:uncharacterized protein (TIGR03083 family)